MAGPNGTARLPARATSPFREPLRLVPETISVPVETADGETTVLAFYRKGPGCPITVAIAVEEAWAEWEEDRPTAEETGSRGDPSADPPVPPTPGMLSTARWLAKNNRAERLLRRNLLCATGPELDEAGANILASDDGGWESILVAAGWWDATPAPAAENADPEAQGEAIVLTGDVASPDSAPPTQATTR